MTATPMSGNVVARESGWSSARPDRMAMARMMAPTSDHSWPSGPKSAARGTIVAETMTSGQRERNRPLTVRAPASSRTAKTTSAVTKTTNSSTNQNRLATKTPPSSNPKTMACQSGRPARLSIRALTSRTCSSSSETAASSCSSASAPTWAGSNFFFDDERSLIRPRAARLLSS